MRAMVAALSWVRGWRGNRGTEGLAGVVAFTVADEALRMVGSRGLCKVRKGLGRTPIEFTDR
jgi:hypothetical protein